MKKNLSILLIFLVLVSPVFSAKQVSFNILKQLELKRGNVLHEFFSNKYCKHKKTFFINTLIKEIKQEFDFEPDLQEVLEMLMNNFANYGLNEDQLVLAKIFLNQLIEKENQNAIHKFRNYEQNNKQNNKSGPELELPDNLALGFIAIFVGGLLCIVPSGITQAIGTGLIAGGALEIGHAWCEGERPYYVDPKTGDRVESPEKDDRKKNWRLKTIR